MSKRMVFLNVLMAMLEFLICLSVIAGFSYAAYHFAKWWINIFSLIPLLLFSGHGLIIDADLKEAEGGEEDNA